MNETKNYYCSSKEHERIKAISYCKKCEIYMCNKCEIIHSKLCQNHQIFKLDKDLNEIFTGYCQEKNHNEKLEFFCKSHNKLCCVSCLCKIKDKGKGQHHDCEVCLLESIEDEKKAKLKDNIQNLDNLSNNLKDSINELKEIFEKLKENKENIKLEIQKEFTKLRNELNEREDQLLLQAENIFNENYFDENLIKESEKLPNKVSLSLEKGKILTQNWKEENLNLLINECINIENNIKIIETINEKINYSKYLNDVKMSFSKYKECELIESMKKYGTIKIANILIDLNDSLILSNNYKHFETIYNWINPNNKIVIELLYRKSRDGDSYNTFHQLCDNKGKTLILIKGTENFIIEAYTPINWTDYSDEWFKDDESFVFSLTNNKIYRKKEKSTQSIFCSKNCGPWFGGIGFRDNGRKNMSQGEFVFSREGWEFYGNINDIIPNEGKSRYFEVEEVEIYKLLF